jgi:hypothetical protein
MAGMCHGQNGFSMFDCENRQFLVKTRAFYRATPREKVNFALTGWIGMEEVSFGLT